MKRTFVLFILLNSSLVFSQKYPDWFLNQGTLNCTDIAIGISERSYVNDTAAISLAFKNACLQLTKQKYMKVYSDNYYWTTALGKAWMGSEIREGIDTTLFNLILGRVQIIDTFKTDKILAVIVSEEPCYPIVNNSFLTSIDSFKIPNWVRSLPEDDHYYFSLGVAPQYFYESSSWNEAEASALRKLAEIKQIMIRSLQKVDESYEEKQNVIVSTELYNSEVIARWRDLRLNIYYVLARCPVQ